MQHHEEAGDTAASESENPPPRKRIRRQRLGIRLSPEPYYMIAEHTPSRLELRSHPDANLRAGRKSMGVGIAIALLTPVIVVSIFITGGGTVSTACSGALLGWPFAAIGFYLWNGGRAIATTINTITLEHDTRTIVYTQQNKVNRPRSQTLDFDQIAQLRLRPRPYLVSRLTRQRREVMALEMVTDEGFIWLVDSSMDSEALAPIATAMSDTLGLPLQQLQAEKGGLQPAE